MDAFSILIKNINSLLEQHGWSQSELARRSGVSQKTINNIASNRGESSSTTITTLEAIAQAFGLDTAQLLSDNFGAGQTLPSNLAEDLSQLLKYFLAAEPEGRKAILRMAQSEARIAHTSHVTVSPRQKG